MDEKLVKIRTPSLIDRLFQSGNVETYISHSGEDERVFHNSELILLGVILVDKSLGLLNREYNIIGEAEIRLYYDTYRFKFIIVSESGDHIDYRDNNINTIYFDNKLKIIGEELFNDSLYDIMQTIVENSPFKEELEESYNYKLIN